MATVTLTEASRGVSEAHTSYHSTTIDGLADLKRQWDGLKATNADLTLQLQAEGETNRRLTGRVEALEATNREISGQKDAANATLATTRESLEQETAAKTAAERRADTAESEANSVKAELVALKAEMERNKRQVAALFAQFGLALHE